MRINFSKRIAAILLAMAMILSLLPATALAVEPEGNDITILYTNDVHTYINKSLSYATIAEMKDEYEAAGKNVLLVDAGDHIQGTAYGSMDEGETILKLMNASGYDLATLGNHEFDYGMDGAMQTIAWADFPYISCNFYDLVEEDLVLDSYKVFDFDGVKVAFVGITTPESFTKSTPAYFQDGEGNYIYDIFGGEDGSKLYEAAQTAIDAASKEADYVIALGHLGDDPASQPWTSLELIANTTGLDAFIDGHSHSTVDYREVTDKAGNTVVLTQTGSYFDAIGKMVIAEDGTITTELVRDYTGSDEEVAKIQQDWMDKVDEELGEIIGYAEVTFDNYDETGKRLVRTYETNTGDFAADALYYLFDNMGLDVDFAIMNGGGVRNKAVTGEMSYKTCKDIHTFGNVACLQTITGQQMLDALEFGARFAEDAECGGFLQVSGLKYEIHTYIENTIPTDDKGVWQGSPTGEYRVKNVQVWNKETETWEPLDLEAKYNLAGYNYTLRDLGDGFAMFDGAVNVLDYVMEDYMVLANYVKSFPASEEHGGLPTITAENSPYGDLYGEGRITVYSTLAETYTDLDESQFYYPGACFCVENGYMIGIGNNQFAPAMTLNRATVVTVLYRMAGEPEFTTTDSFPDVAPNRYYTDAVNWAVENDIVLGYEDNTFRPDRAVTRQEMATLFYRYADFLGYNVDKSADLSTFTDYKTVSSYAQDAMEWAVSVGLIVGMENDTLQPRGLSTRGQFATVVYRFLNCDVVINLMATSDIHGQAYATDYTADASASGTHYQALTRVATFVKEQREIYDNTFLVDCGDLIQGTPLTYYYAFEKGDVEDPSIKALRMMDYDMFVPGNHEFNYGMAILQRQLDYLTSEPTETEDTVTVSCANYLDTYKNSDEEKDWSTWNDYAPYVLYDFDGVTVAVMGIANPNIPQWDVPANWEGIYFAGVIETYKQYEAEMREQADLVVLASHSGIDSDPVNSDFIRQLVSETNTIDLVFTGHEHRNDGVNGVKMIENSDGVEVPVFSLSTKAAVVGQAVVTYNKIADTYTMTAGNVAMAARDENRVWQPLYDADPELEAALKPYETATWEDYMLQPIGRADGNFTSANLGGAPSAFVDLVNKVQIWGAYDRTGDNTPDDTSDDTPAQLSITAPLTAGSAENLIPEGDIVLGDMFKLYRYENWFYQITMTGKEVRTWLEYSASKVEVLDDGSVFINGGLTYYDVIYGEGFSYIIDPNQPSGSRIVSMTYNGEEVADDAVFTVVVNNYRYNGGGNYIQYLNDHGCDFTPNDESRIIYSTQYDMNQGEDKGQARNLLADYIREAGVISPVIESTWSIILD